MYSEIFFEKIFFEIFEIFEKNLKIWVLLLLGFGGVQPWGFG